MVKTFREFELRGRAAWNTGWVDHHNSAVASGASRVAGSLVFGDCTGAEGPPTGTRMNFEGQVGRRTTAYF